MRGPRKGRQETLEAAPKLRRESLEVKAERAVTAMDSPEVRRAFEGALRENMGALERLELDGTQASADKALELVRRRQAILSVQAEMLRPLARQMMAQLNNQGKSNV